MKFIKIEVYNLHSITFWVGVTSDNVTHLTMDSQCNRPVFSRKTEVGQTWSFFTQHELDHYLADCRYYNVTAGEVLQYFIVFDNEIKSVLQ